MDQPSKQKCHDDVIVVSIIITVKCEPTMTGSAYIVIGDVCVRWCLRIEFTGFVDSFAAIVFVAAATQQNAIFTLHW